MSLRLYNTFTKKEEDFVPAKAGEVTMYTCGPTVYGRPHIGNYSSFLMADLLNRWLTHGHKYKVNYAKNITDVGHLVADRDEGEDKIEKEAKAEHLDPLTVAERYTTQYIEDEKALNLLEPTHRPRATHYIKEMLTIIKTLMEKGNAYETEDGIYFAVETFKAYGKLSGNTLKELNAGSRVQVDEAKRHPADFALWKKCVGANADHILRWAFADGKHMATLGEDPAAGFPGWHIECSAMASALLGNQIDIHTGGEDNIFPHHECEIAQSECCFGVSPFVRLWLHKRRIDLKGEKMSKSLGNVLTLPSITDKGYSPLDLRYYLLSVHYRTNLKFAWKGMDDAKIARKKIVEWIETVQKNVPVAGDSSLSNSVRESAENFAAAMDQDLNTPGALAQIFDVMNFYYKNEKKISAHDHAACLSFINMIKQTFGCFEPEAAGEVPLPVQALLQERVLARAKKDFAESDRLREEIKKHGYDVRDGAGGQEARKL